jgi:ribonuclease HI
MSETTFHCGQCGKEFTVKPEVLARYPGWTPRVCWPCKNKSQGKPASAAKTAARQRRPPRRPAAAEENLTGEQVLAKYTEGPKTGVFTDGACVGNPGPGGWGVVWVEDDRVVDERRGHEPQTTNNRMELVALINAYEMLPADAAVTLYSDSNLCVQTINVWAAGWKCKGWKRKGGEVKNLELVQRAYDLSLRHRKTKLQWIKAHDGSRWNEYADSLATAFLRETK